MTQYSELRRGRHVVCELHVHLVFVTKYRRQVFDADALTRLAGYFASICADFSARLEQCNGEHDHAHLLVTYGPTLQLSKLVNSLKGASSRLLQRDRPDIQKSLCGKALWSPSYFAASCGGAPLNILKTYIEQQRAS